MQTREQRPHTRPQILINKRTSCSWCSQRSLELCAADCSIIWLWQSPIRALSWVINVISYNLFHVQILNNQRTRCSRAGSNCAIYGSESRNNYLIRKYHRAIVHSIIWTLCENLLAERFIMITGVQAWNFQNHFLR